MSRLLKFFAYLAGGLIILLAIAVGLFRLFLPRLPEYQEDIKGWASAAIGMTVEFSGMDARWGLSGPEVEFYNAELLSQDTMARFVAADEVSVGVGLIRLLLDRKFVVDRVAIRDTSIEIRQLENGEWWIQGSPLDQLFPGRRGNGAGNVGSIDIEGEDIELRFLQPGDQRPKRFRVSRVVATRDKVRIAVDATVELPGELGRRLNVTATQLLSDPPEGRHWDIDAELQDVRLAGISALQPEEKARFDAGRGDIDLSLAVANKRIESAMAELDIENIAIAGLSDMAISGRLEFLMDDNGWLFAADELRASTPEGEWPASQLRFEASTNDAGQIVMIDARASYLDVGHIGIAEPWLSENYRSLMSRFDPSGIIRNLDMTASDINSESPKFDLSVAFENVGIAAEGNRPGVRGVSGNLRADHSGGLLELDSTGVTVTAARAFREPLTVDEASGTVIWRRALDGTTVLSDSIVLRNTFFDSEISVELSIAEDGSAPVIDLESSFSVSDIAQAAALVPFMPRRPNISRWFQSGFEAGRVTGGRARLNGPLDKFPFDKGDGVMLVRGKLRDGVVKYLPRWPVSQVVEAEVIMENLSLRSHRNRVINVGNETIDAKFDISHFRIDPQMTLSSSSEGTAESLRQLALQSPINEMLGNQLDQVSVSGDAFTTLELHIPIRDAKNFRFVSEVQVSDASVEIEGFPAPVTELGGVVIIERESVASEDLSGMFLGQPVAIELEPAPEDMPEFRVIANATGAATVEAVQEQLGLPIAARASGAATWSARLLFPRGRMETPEPFTIEIETDLVGVGIDLPEPLGKAHDDALGISAQVTMQKGGEGIETRGHADAVAAWHVSFTRDEAWDLDRGVAVFGVDDVGDVAAETRGLHLRGETDYIYAQDWYDLAKDSEAQLGIGERIRSIDINVGNLHLIGQHLVDHRFQMDRSGNEWHVELEGDRVQASVIVPYDFNSGQPIVVEAEKLLLPGDETDEDRPKVRVDPRNLPPVAIKAQAMAFGNRNFGSVDANFERTADGLVAEGIVARDETFEIVGNGGWVIDESDPAGSRSSIMATLTSTAVEQTMQRLDYNPGIRSKQLSMLLDLSWSGGPSADLMETLDGSVKVRIGEGKLEEVRPGAGRVFGLLSVTELPRRLALDFRDVFGKGFAFDQINGDFRLEDGETYTCNLTLEGPAASIGIVGRAGLVSREYEQTAVISANFGNALPVAGALVAGPQVAAALLIFSRIFKKPLQEVTQIYYRVDGDFDAPDMQTITAEEFAASGVAMGCIEDGEGNVE
ncbi:MAG: TIGR02099 family protein [Woeseiaceae bacterium]|nr:TIGR02099 family protein [Woeseiaceae bacterium]